MTNGFDAVQQKAKAHATSALKPVINSNVSVTSSVEEGILQSRAPIDELESVIPEHSRLPETINSTLKPLISAKHKEAVESKLENAHLSHENNSVSESIVTRQQGSLSSLKNRNAPARQTSTSLIQDENQTIINVSIGQIDIKATSADSTDKKPLKRSRRSDASALEAYHQKRVRGQQ